MIHLYNRTPGKGQSFEGVKSVVVPNQSMTLKQILQRFMKKQSLPIEHPGVFVEGEHDLEKLSKEDFVVKHELLEEQKKIVARKKKVAEDVAKAVKELMEQKDPKKDPKPAGNGGEGHPPVS